MWFLSLRCQWLNCLVSTYRTCSLALLSRRQRAESKMWHLCLKFTTGLKIVHEGSTHSECTECRCKNQEWNISDNRPIKNKMTKKIHIQNFLFLFSLDDLPKSVSFVAPKSQSGRFADDNDKPESLTSNNVFHLLQGRLQHVAGVGRHRNQTGTSQIVDELAERSGQMRCFFFRSSVEDGSPPSFHSDASARRSSNSCSDVQVTSQ